MKLWLALFTLLSFSSITYADNLEFALSDEVIEATMQNFYSDSFSSQAALLHADDDKQTSDLISFGLFANGKTGSVRTHLGGKLFWMEGEKVDSRGLALGGAVDAFLTPKLFIVGSIFYAPDITTGGDFDNYLDLGVKLSYQILENTALFIGVRSIEVEKDNFDYEVYEGLLFGFRFNI